MGQIPKFTKEQKIILDLISKTEALTKDFYFTGGTALSEFYLHHRYSDDLDFFTDKKLDQQLIFTLMSEWGDTHHFRFTSRFVQVVYRFELTFPNKTLLKVDFGYFPYKRLEKGIRYQNLPVDSQRDIATNKITTINQRTEVKDFVDLYFLLKKYTIWDLLYCSEIKFKSLDIDIMLIAQDFLKTEDFKALPRMIKPLTLETVKRFFRVQAKTLAKKVTV